MDLNARDTFEVTSLHDGCFFVCRSLLHMGFSRRDFLFPFETVIFLSRTIKECAFGKPGLFYLNRVSVEILHLLQTFCIEVSLYFCTW